MVVSALIPQLSYLVGHSARDTYEMLHKRNVEMTAKPFAIGVRIEHDQAVIDESQYGVEPFSLGLGAAEYSLVYHDKETGRTAYSLYVPRRPSCSICVRKWWRCCKWHEFVCS